MAKTPPLVLISDKLRKEILPGTTVPRQPLIPHLVQQIKPYVKLDNRQADKNRPKGRVRNKRF